eukprot:Skav203006  [mRNA]  locus=scaffold1344:212005:212205:+ [translate_table: standard]
MWFAHWRDQASRANRHRCHLEVVTKEDDSLGRSQEGEVRFLEEEAMKIERIKINDFADVILSGEGH